MSICGESRSQTFESFVGHPAKQRSSLQLFQNDLYEWTRDHRVHHKYSETDADPHNVNRGFFFAHVGWLMCKKHPEVFLRGKSVDCSDLLQDPVIRFQKACYVPLVAIICFYMPMVLPYYLFGESYLNGFFVAGMTRYVLSLNFTWLVNSAAHIWGNKPYDKNISPVENAFVSLVAIGEGKLSCGKSCFRSYGYYSFSI